MKKSIFLFFAAILCAIGMNAADITSDGTARLYFNLKAVSWWNAGTDGNGNFGYFFNNSTGKNAWSAHAVKYSGDTYYLVIPKGTWAGVILTRNNTSTAPSWDNKWNQTGDITLSSTSNYISKFSEGSAIVTWGTPVKPASDASVSAAASTIFVGASTTLTPSLTSNANINDIKSTTYTISPTTGASISGNTFTASAEGTYTITATVTYHPDGYSNTKLQSTATATTTIKAEVPAEETHDVTVSYICGETKLQDPTTVNTVGVETPVKVTAPEIAKYTFANWTLGADVATTDALTSNEINITTKAGGSDFTLVANYEKAKLTYTVTVPAGTENCYMAGEMNGWDVDNPIELTKQSENVFTVTLEGVEKTQKYKYLSKKGTWDYAEDGGDRTWTANDVVTAWKDPLATDVYLAGSMTDWANSKLTFKKATIDATTATVSVTLDASTEYYFKVIRGSDWTSSKDNRDIKASVSGLVFSKDISDNTKLTTAAAGNYVFTWDINQSQLSIAYPEVTPEYKDITIQVYAKEVPNIWWWNGGGQCPSTEELINPSTGDKYKWTEAPAMEKVAGEDNWYTKTFAQVDITKGGIKFKLQSTDHNTSTTNEVVTTEDKCYDARVIATVTETTCGELPSGEVPTVTYNVTVPTGTPACYIAGAMNGWSHQAMTKVDETHYTITIEGAQKTQEYKYSASNNWDLVELNEDGSEKSNRTWTENDVVAKWATPPTYTIVGASEITGANWDLANENNKMAKSGEVYTLTKTGLKLVAGDYEYKVVKNGAWGDGEYPNGTNEKVTIAENGEYTIVYTYTVGTSLTAVATKTGEYTPAPVEVKYYLVGTMNSWTNGDATYELSLEGDGLYHYNVTLNAGTHEFKVYDATGVNTYGYAQLTKKNYNELSEGEYNNIKLTLTANAEVAITFNGETKAITLTSTALTENTAALTYTVTVPASTAKCYICGAWDWNTFMEMTPTANANEFTIDIVGATASQEYKYTCGQGWEYAEVNADGSTRANRTYNANDVVEKWADVITYVLMGVNGDWTTGIQLTKNSETEYMLLGQTITRNTDKIKVVTLTNGTATAWCGNVDTYSDAIYENDWDKDGNIALEDGIYDFYFKLNDVNEANDDQIYIDQTALLRTGTNKYGTVYVPYTPASVSGATFYQVAGKGTENGTAAVYLESVNTIEAGKPYIYERTGNQVVKIEFSGAKATNGGAVNGLVGTDATTTDVANGHYLLYNNAFCKSDGSNKVRGYRAYLVMENITGGKPTQMPGRRYIGMSVQGENEATGVEDLFTTDAPVKVIENGQLIIIRDGVKYNVQGQKL